jgi:putative transcriptional regulator
MEGNSMALLFLRQPLVAVASLAAVLGVLTPSLSAQTASDQVPGIGKLLVARSDAPDRVFGKTVILLVRYQRDGTLGVIINRPTDVPVSRALHGVKGAEGREEPVYAGGPVAIRTALALLHANVMPEEGVTHVHGKVYTLADGRSLEKTLESKTGPAELRVFMGYSGWARGQLENEIENGFWHVLPADAELAFDPEPETLWSRLVARAEQHIARVFFPGLPGNRR